jgi:tetratricopeptide (TPR) repeat protein
MKRPLFTILTVLAVSQGFAQTDSSDYFYQKGSEEKVARRYLPAFNNFQKSVQFKPENVDAQTGLGQVSVELRKYEDAKKAFLKVLELKKDDTTAVANLANLYFWTRKWEDAIKYALKAKSLNVGSNNNYNIAKAYYEQENYGKSLEFLEMAYKDDNKNAEVPYLGARCLIEMSNYKKAAGCYEQAIALDSTKTLWMYEAGLTYYAIPDDNKSIYWLERAGANGYKRTNDYLQNLSNAYLNIKQWDKGLPLLEELLQRKPQDVEVIYSVAEVYYNTKKYDMAIETWDKILAIDNKNANAVYMIGLAYQKKGETAKGQELCDKAIAMDPNLAKLKEEKKMPM